MGVDQIQASHYIHSIIWVKCPQNVFIERQTLEIGVYSPVIEFNEGCHGIHKVIEYIGLETGSRLITKSRQRDSVRARKKMVKNCSEKGKKKRKTLRGVKKDMYIRRKS